MRLKNYLVILGSCLAVYLVMYLFYFVNNPNVNRTFEDMNKYKNDSGGKVLNVRNDNNNKNNIKSGENKNNVNSEKNNTNTFKSADNTKSNVGSAVTVKIKREFQDHRLVNHIPSSNLTDTQILFGDITPLSDTVVKDIRSNNIVSMSLYGKDKKYLIGALRNAKLVRKNFPGWKLRIYTEFPDANNSHVGVVPRDVLKVLESAGVEIKFIDPSDNLPSMMWRFLIADDSTVDVFIIRDSDSMLTKRDYAATMAWMKSNQTVHSIRDHPSHGHYPISGGLWGARRARLKSLIKVDWKKLITKRSNDYLADMNMLNTLIYPKVSQDIYCSDSVSCNDWPNSFPFPVRRYGFEHVGQVFDSKGLGRRIDVSILEKWGGNNKCVTVGEMRDLERDQELTLLANGWVG